VETTEDIIIEILKIRQQKQKLPELLSCFNSIIFYIMGDWRKLHNEELHNLYSSPNIIRMIKSRRMRWAGHVPRMGETRNAYRILVGKPEGKRPLGRPRRRWVVWDDMDWIKLAQDRDQWRTLVNTVMNLRVP
jgi:hypothetical protein